MPSPSLPPLLRGLGTSLLLLSAALTVWYEREQMAASDNATLAHVSSAERATLLHELHRLNLRIEDNDLADEVFENPWFQLLSLLGTGLISASFFVEWRVRKQEQRVLAAQPQDASSVP